MLRDSQCADPQPVFASRWAPPLPSSTRAKPELVLSQPDSCPPHLAQRVSHGNVPLQPVPPPPLLQLAALHVIAVGGRWCSSGGSLVGGWERIGSILEAKVAAQHAQRGAHTHSCSLQCYIQRLAYKSLCPPAAPLQRSPNVLLLIVPLQRHLANRVRSEEHTSELQSHLNLVCRLLLEKKKQNKKKTN